MATIAPPRSTLTRRVNRIFRKRRGQDLTSYGLYTPERVRRVPSDISPSDDSTDLGSLPFKYIEVPMLDEEGNPILDRNGNPKIRRQKVALSPSELDANKDQIEAEKKRKEEEEHIRKEEEERAAKIAAMREKNVAVFSEHNGGAPKANAEQALIISRHLGFAPTAAEMRKLEDSKGAVDYDELILFLTNEISVGENADELSILFKGFDKNNSGKLSKMQIHNVLTSYGEPLTNEEFTCLLETLGETGDMIDYVQFVKKLLED